MPFDGAPAKTIWEVATELAQRRREKAAEIWRNVPAEKFDISTWCGSPACALGWLGKLKIDGWDADVYPIRGGKFGFDAGQSYFGLDYNGGNTFTPDTLLYGVRHHSQITASMVADCLLQQPIVLNDDLLAEAQQETANAV